MSTMPWGTMNGWLRLESEQRGTWLQQRVQDLRAAQVAHQVAPQPESEGRRLTLAMADRQPQAVPDCREAEAQARVQAQAVVQAQAEAA